MTTEKRGPKTKPIAKKKRNLFRRKPRIHLKSRNQARRPRR